MIDAHPYRCPKCAHDLDVVYEEVDIGVGVQRFAVALECRNDACPQGGVCGLCFGCGALERVGSVHAAWCRDHPGETVTSE